MRHVMICGIAAATLGFMVTAPASAFPAAMAPLSGVSSSGTQVEQAQFRRHGGHHFGGRHYGYRGGYYRGNRGYGAGVGAGIAGLAAGAIIGGAIANAQTPTYYGYGEAAPAGDAVAYCSQRFRSYDPASGTYLGYDGDRHPCP